MFDCTCSDPPTFGICDFILPIHEDKHWVLFHLNLPSHQMICYDSLGGDEDELGEIYQVSHGFQIRRGVFMFWIQRLWDLIKPVAPYPDRPFQFQVAQVGSNNLTLDLANFVALVSLCLSRRILSIAGVYYCLCVAFDAAGSSTVFNGYDVVYCIICRPFAAGYFTFISSQLVSGRPKNLKYRW